MNNNRDQLAVGPEATAVAVAAFLTLAAVYIIGSNHPSIRRGMMLAAATLARSTVVGWIMVTLYVWEPAGRAAGAALDHLNAACRYLSRAAYRWIRGRSADRYEELVQVAISAANPADEYLVVQRQVEEPEENAAPHLNGQSLVDIRARDPRRRARIVRFLASVVRGGLQAMPHHRSEAQLQTAREWLVRYLKEEYRGAFRHSDAEWVVPAAVEMAYTFGEIDYDLRQMMSSEAARVWIERANGSWKRWVLDRIDGVQLDGQAGFPPPDQA